MRRSFNTPQVEFKRANLNPNNRTAQTLTQTYEELRRLAQVSGDRRLAAKYAALLQTARSEAR